MPEALPAVIVPGFRKGVLSLASPSSVVSGRGCSSVATVSFCHRDRHDLFAEKARRPRFRRPPLAAVRERILVRALDPELLGDILAGLGHGIDAVLSLQQGVDEPPAERGVLDRSCALEGDLGLAHHERRPRHGFDTAGDRQLDFARLDCSRGRTDRIQPGSAEPVDRGARHHVRQAGEQECHPRHVAVVLACLIGAPHEDVVESRPIDGGVPRHERPERNCREIIGPHVGERPAIAPDRGPHGVADEGLSHCRSPSWVIGMW